MSQRGKGSAGTSKRKVDDDEYIVRLRGVPHSAKSEDIIEFLSGCMIVNGAAGIHRTSIGSDKSNRDTVYIELETDEDLTIALSLNMTELKGQLVEVDKATRSDVEKTKRDDKGYKDMVIILRGFSWGTTNKDILSFLDGVNVDEKDIHLVYDEQLRTSGDCYVQLRSAGEVIKALKKHMKTVAKHTNNQLTTRYIEVALSTDYALRTAQEKVKKILDRASRSDNRKSPSTRRRSRRSPQPGRSRIEDRRRRRLSRSRDRIDVRPTRSYRSRSKSDDKMSDIGNRPGKRIRRDDSLDHFRRGDDSVAPINEYKHNKWDPNLMNPDFKVEDADGGGVNQNNKNNFEWDIEPAIDSNTMEMEADNGNNIEKEYENFMASITDDNGKMLPSNEMDDKNYWPVPQNLLRRAAIEDNPDNIAKLVAKFGRPLNNIGDDHWQTFDEVQVLIVHQNYPTRQLNGFEINQLCSDICNIIINTGNVYPQFNRSRPLRGSLFVACHDIKSYRWLKKTVDTFYLADGTKFRVIRRKKDRYMIKMKATIPCHAPLDPEKVRQALMIQNSDLYTGNWTMIDREMNSNGQTMIWSGLPGAFKALEKHNFTAFLGLKAITFRKVIDRPEPVSMNNMGS